MNFTREPLIETIITPKEGYKLVIRSSKGDSQEEYIVDAVEVVSFGHSFFFRSLERARSFLVPITDFEVIEVKETRVALKNVGTDRAIKIGGGREASLKMPKETEKSVELPSTEGIPAVAEATSAPMQEQRMEKKREKRRHRRRHSQESRSEIKEEVRVEEIAQEEGKIPEEGMAISEELPVSPAVFSRLFPPPPMLISEKYGKLKEKQSAEPPAAPIEQPTEDIAAQSFEREEEKQDDDFPSNTEGHEMSRLSSQMMQSGLESTSFSQTKEKTVWWDFFSNRNPFKG